MLYDRGLQTAEQIREHKKELRKEMQETQLKVKYRKKIMR